MATTQRPQVDNKRAQAFFNSRTLVPANMIGRRITVFVRNDGNVIDVQDKAGLLVMEINNPDTVLRKRIFNAQSNSEHAITAAPNRQLLKDAMAAEKAGDAAKASELFNDYLNKVQFSFSVLSTSSLFDKLQGGTEVTGVLQEIVTDNGKLLTLDPGTIAIKEAAILTKPATSMWNVGEEEPATDWAKDTEVKATGKPGAKATVTATA